MNNNVSRYAIVFAYALLFVAQNYSKGIKLENSVLPLVDGIPYAIDGTTVKDMLHIRREVRKMQFGHMTQNKQLEGSYEFQGAHYSLHQLALKERDLEMTIAEKQADICGRYVRRDAFCQAWNERQQELLRLHEEKMMRSEEELLMKYQKRHDRQAYEHELTKMRRVFAEEHEQKMKQAQEEIMMQSMQNSDACRAELDALSQERMCLLEPFQRVLRQAKDDFKIINEPYLASIRGTKSMMVLLVEESCQKRGRYTSFLLEWAHVAEGKELESFERSMQSLQMLDVFCSDLTNFIEDVIVSCPKGCAQAGLTLPAAA